MLVFLVVLPMFLQAQCPNGFWDGGNRVIQLQPHCYIEYHYCWRTIFDENMNEKYYDIWIGDISIYSTTQIGCNIIIDFDNNSELYRQYVMIDIINKINPHGANIPECPSQSQGFYRLGTYSCYLPWQDVWELPHPDVGSVTGTLVLKHYKKQCNNIALEFFNCYKWYTICRQVVTIEPLIYKYNLIQGPITNLPRDCNESYCKSTCK